eukprot:3722272-Amphidinium_carterae.1
MATSWPHRWQNETNASGLKGNSCRENEMLVEIWSSYSDAQESFDTEQLHMHTVLLRESSRGADM